MHSLCPLCPLCPLWLKKLQYQNMHYLPIPLFVMFDYLCKTDSFQPQRTQRAQRLLSYKENLLTPSTSFPSPKLISKARFSPVLFRYDNKYALAY